MIKIERSTATKPTILRNGVLQPVTLNMTVTKAELDSLQAEGGTITYSVDEQEVHVVDFQPSEPAVPTPITEALAVTDTVATTTVAKPIIQPARKTAKTTQA